MQNEKNYPYTIDQLKQFKKELEESGGADELMFKKEALVRNNDMTMIATYRNIEGYKEKHLTGVYESLRPLYKTEVPYVFWSKLYDMLKRI